MSRNCLAALVLLACCQASLAAPRTSPFGINGAGWSHLGANTPTFDWETGIRRLDSLQAMGAAWDRCDFWWHRIEPEPNRFVWRDYDRVADEYARRGLNLLPILCYDAAWHPGQSPNTEAYRAEYGRYVRATVAHFKGRITAYEIWNEPNISEFWRVRPDADDYVRLLRVAYREAKRADPGVTIVGGAVAGMDFPFIERMMKAGAGGCMDAISVHPYQGNLGSVGPEAGGLGADLRRLKALLKRYGRADLPIWITEMGNRTVPDPSVKPGGAQPSGRVSEQQQASYVARSYAIALSEGVRRIFWFNLQDWPSETWGTLSEADWRRKPSWYAYRTASRMLTGRSIEGVSTAVPGAHLLRFRAGGAAASAGPLLVGWTEGPGLAVELRGSGMSTARWPSRSGQDSVLTISGPVGGVVLNGEPVYISGPLKPRTPAVRLSLSPPVGVAGDTVRIVPAGPRLPSTRLAKHGEPFLLGPDSHVPVPNGLSRAARGEFRVGRVPPGQYLAGLRLAGGAVAASSIRVEPAVSVAARPDPGAGRALSIAVTNRSSRPITATVTVDRIGHGTDLIPGVVVPARGSVPLPIAGAQPAETPLAVPLPVTVEAAYASGRATWAGNVYFLAARQGGFGPPLRLDSAQNWQAPDAAPWGGAPDLSLLFSARHDPRGLTLHAEVTDDVHHQADTLGEVWRGDSFQIGIDPRWTRRPDTSEAVELGLALTPSGPQVFRWTPPAGLVAGATLTVRREGVRTIYDAVLPWRALGLAAPHPPQTIGFAFICNDNDGRGREGWLMYGDGIATEKRADRYATLTLLP